MISKQDYRNFKHNTLWPHCWLCGREERDRPAWWNAPFGLDRAHIVSTPRNEDIRVINLLCSWCHGISHGTRYAAERRPPITLATKLWLKERFDPANFSLEFLQHFSVRRLPAAEAPHAIYLAEYRKRHPGEVLVG